MTATDVWEQEAKLQIREVERLKEINAEQLAALEAADRLCKKALPEFDWGRSALSADSIRLLNEVPGQIRAAIAKAKP